MDVFGEKCESDVEMFDFALLADQDEEGSLHAASSSGSSSFSTEDDESKSDARWETGLGKPGRDTQPFSPHVGDILLGVRT